MRRTVLALLILCAPAAARADDAEAPGCRLSAAECAVVLHEVAVDAEAFARDEELLGLGLPPAERARALIGRDTERMAERFRHLAAPVAAEVGRMQACRMLDGAPPRDGGPDADPQCR